MDELRNKIQKLQLSTNSVLISGVVYTHLYVAGKVCSVLIKEVSLLVYTHLYVAGKVCSVLIKEVSLFQG